MTPTQLIAFLNALNLGDLDRLRMKLEEAGNVCVALGQAELAERLVEAREALGSGDVRLYRKRIETVLARLGHIK